jgi:hypothetical protein
MISLSGTLRLDIETSIFYTSELTIHQQAKMADIWWPLFIESYG